MHVVFYPRQKNQKPEDIAFKMRQDLKGTWGNLFTQRQYLKQVLKQHLKDIWTGTRKGLMEYGPNANKWKQLKWGTFIGLNNLGTEPVSMLSDYESMSIELSQIWNHTRPGK